mgnify:FL=1
MNVNYAKDEFEFEWGKITREDILRRIYRQKSLDEMSEEEIDKMLNDLI